jgi:hypothetical protein
MITTKKRKLPTLDASIEYERFFPMSPNLRLDQSRDSIKMALLLGWSRETIAYLFGMDIPDGFWNEPDIAAAAVNAGEPAAWSEESRSRSSRTRGHRPAGALQARTARPRSGDRRH